jgi:uncharacterized protein (DUF362 family)/ferredoxin
MNREQPLVSCARVSDLEIPIAQHMQSLLTALGGISRFISAGDRVLLKPNWVAPFPQAVTDWELIVAVVEMVRSTGATPFLAESSGFEFSTEATFRALGLYEQAAARDLELINLDLAEMTPVTTPLGEIELARPALDADVIINLPRLKYHSLTKITGAQKNILGLVSRASRRKIHARDLDRGIVAVNRVLRPQLHILDGRDYLTRAVYGQVEHLGIVLASSDPLASDHLGARILGYDPQSIGHIRLALQALPESAHYTVVGDRVDSLDHAAGATPGRFYRFTFQTAYRVDLVLSHLFPKTSIIPHVHFWLGIRPHVTQARCTGCAECVQVCPVEAIRVDQVARISAKRCMELRCLRCVEACPERAIEIRGMRRPR